MYEIQIQVTPADIDELGHVNNVTYLRWVQDVAVAHWNAIAPAEDIAALFWVVLRHEIDYKQAALEGDHLTVKTWVGNAGRLKYERNTEIRRGDTLLAKALTIWCPMDRHTKRPIAPSDAVRALFSSSDRQAG